MQNNRDLLIVNRDLVYDSNSLQHEIELLNQMLFSVEKLHHFSIAHEIIDVNKYKIIQKQHIIQQKIREHSLKPFQFLFCKN
jgi:hypothetical protein